MEKKNTNLPLKLFAVITFIIMVTVNALSALLPINGITPGEVSDSYPNLFAPAGITFSRDHPKLCVNLRCGVE